MPETHAKDSTRDVVGRILLNNKVAMAVALLLVASIITFNLVPSIFGVPTTLLLIWFLAWLMRTKWTDLGIRRPPHWGKTIAIGVGVAVVSQAFTGLVLLPLFQRLGLGSPDYSGFENIKGNVGAMLMYLMVSWTIAGIGEEIIYRGFLMEQLARLIGGKAKWVLSLVLVSALFGLGHAYQGAVGVYLTAYSALVYGVLYISRGRNLWYSIIAHGTADTIAFLALYTGLMQSLL